jgi:hypothetical protein
MQVFGEHINQNTHMDIKIVKMIFYFHNFLKNWKIIFKCAYVLNL